MITQIKPVARLPILDSNTDALLRFDYNEFNEYIDLITIHDVKEVFNTGKSFDEVNLTHHLDDDHKFFLLHLLYQQKHCGYLKHTSDNVVNGIIYTTNKLILKRTKEMIKQIMLDEIAEDVVNFRDNVTVTLSQNIPQEYINNFRIVKRGTGGTLVNNPITDHHSVIEGYKNLTMAIFKLFTNFTKYLKKDNKYNTEPITQNRNNIIVRF